MSERAPHTDPVLSAVLPQPGEIPEPWDGRPGFARWVAVLLILSGSVALLGWQSGQLAGWLRMAGWTSAADALAPPAPVGMPGGAGFGGPGGGGGPGAGPGGPGGPGGRAGRARMVPVVAVPARKGDMPVFMRGLGAVTPLATVSVRSRVDGQLMKVVFREGQEVKQGDLLAEIDARPYEVALAQAQGQLARDEALLRNAQVDLERYKTLYKQDSIPRQQLDTQESLVRQYEAALRVDQAAVDSAKLNLSYCRITAPVGGVLGLRQVDVGNMVRASDANGLVVITQIKPISVLFSLPEDNLPKVLRAWREGSRIAVLAFDRADKQRLAAGRLTTIDNQIDPTTGTVRLRGTFANDDAGLFPSQFVTVRMLVDTLKGVTLIPTAAVQRGSQGSFAYVVQEDDTVTVRTLQLGPAQGEQVAVEEGVEVGERVVIDGADKLREGAKVVVVTRPPRGGPGGKPGEGGKPAEADRAARPADPPKPRP